MADLIKKIKIKKQDGTFTDYIPIGAEAKNIITNDGDSVEYKLNKKPYYYNSIVDMKTDSKLKAGDMAITLGYYNINDGGAAEYKIINGSYTDDGGSYHQLDNGLFAELIIKDNGLNVHQFGAKGDGITDDWQAIQNCFLYIKDNNPSSNRMKVKCLNGYIYYISKTLAIFSNTEFDLCGSELLSQKTHALHNFRSTTWGDGWTVSDESTEYNGQGNIYVHNGIFHHGSVSFVHGHDICFENIDFIDCKNNHWFEVCAEKDFVIKGCHFKGITSQTGKEMVQIDTCNRSGFPWFAEDSIVYDLTPNMNITIDSCTFEKGIEETWQYFHRGIGSHISSGSDNKHQNITVKNCIFDGATEHSICPYDWHNSQIIGNTIKNNNGNYPVHIQGYCKDLLVKDNIFMDNTTNSQIMCVPNQTTPQENFTFIGNIFKRTSNSIGINAYFVKNLTVMNNIIFGEVMNEGEETETIYHPALCWFGRTQNVIYKNNTRQNLRAEATAESSFGFDSQENSSTWGTYTTFKQIDEYVGMFATQDETETERIIYNTRYKLTDFNRLFFASGQHTQYQSFTFDEVDAFPRRKFQVGDILWVKNIKDGTHEFQVTRVNILSDNSFEIIDPNGDFHFRSLYAMATREQ